MGDQLTEQQAFMLSSMKDAARQAFRICQDQAEEFAAKIESGELPKFSASVALRMLASMFEVSAKVQ